MFSREEWRKQNPWRYEVGTHLFAELCEKLNIRDKDADYVVLRNLIETFMMDPKNNANDAEVPTKRSFITYKIKQQIASLSKDTKNPLQDDLNPEETIRSYLTKINTYIEHQDKKDGFDNKFLEIIFTEKELPTAIYLLESSSFFSKDDKGLYHVTSRYLSIQMIIDDVPAISAEDEEKIFRLLNLGNP